MKKLVLALVFLLTGGVIYSQTAKVLTLKPNDAAEARALWERLQSAQKDWDAFNTRIGEDYLNGDCGVVTGTTGSITLWYNGKPPGCKLSGWENGFTFSEDFKTIVPKPYSYTTPTWPNTCGYWWGNTWYWNGSYCVNGLNGGTIQYDNNGLISPIPAVGGAYTSKP